MTTRLLRMGMAALLAVPALAAGPRAPLAATCAGAAGAAHHVSIVVQHSGTVGGGVVRACVGFDGAGISGYDALTASGITFGAQYYGSSLGYAICQVDKEPPSYPPNCLQANMPYWSIFRATGGGGWQTTSLGVSRETYVDGDSEGFDFVGTGNDRPMPAPGGCPAATAPPATPPSAPATPPASATPGRTAAATLRPVPSAVAGTVSGAPGSPVSTPGADPSGAAGASPAPPTALPLALAGGEVPGGPSEGATRVGVVARSGSPVIAPTHFSGNALGWLGAGALVAVTTGLLGWQTWVRRRQGS